jgi:hypothetical protein
MNKDRRKRLADVAQRLEECRADIEIIKDEEQDAFDAIPENMQGGERAQQMEEAIGTLESLDGDLQDVIDRCNEVAEL